MCLNIINRLKISKGNTVNWPNIINKLGMTDKSIAEAVTGQGCNITRSGIQALRDGRTIEPRHSVAVALLNLAGMTAKNRHNQFTRDATS